ncbi:Long-chain-fatty-acid--CoA ligase 5 [Oopsacas minuta]|uniref:Long-chain-fatty-acid--CoA ligase n=1 Tax=Oopsacas minuta TaxID=111878 RepID=A0AAV7JUH4_9METZ|nr:Long-chain-fatty-acid--CoA ligase 5 [Oopsacas minuta]
MSSLADLPPHTIETVLVTGLISVIGIAYILLSRRPPPKRMLVDKNRQSKPYKGGDESIRVSALLGEDCELIVSQYDDVKTLYEGFQRGLSVSRDQPCFGTRLPDQPFQYLTYSQIAERVNNFGSGLINRGHIVGQGTFIGISSKNCPEWVIVEQACNAYSQVLVPLYDTLGPEAIVHIITQANTEVVVLSADRFIERFTTVAGTKIPKLVVKIGKPTPEEVNIAKEQNIGLVAMETIEEEGKNAPVVHVPPKEDDLSTICYTSGTTGKPKGAMLTHRNLISVCSAATSILNSDQPVTPDDEYLSYLPLAHVFERIMQVNLLMHGARICFFQGDVKLLLNDLAACKPTIFASVPRLLNRIYDKTMVAVNASPIKKKLFQMAMRSKQADIEKGIICKTTIWDTLVFKKIQAGLGGRVRVAVTGAAPLSQEVMIFLKCALGCDVYEGYGQTESGAAATLCMPGEALGGHVGPPLPCNIVKVVDVPDMEYYAKNGEGEVCFKGPNVFKGYLHDEFKTKEAIDSDGWLHSGDIGKWLDNGCLKIIDRKKHIVKLSNGEYIAPEKIENCYTRHPAIMQAFVHANSLYPFPVAILVADPDTFEGWAKSRGFTGTIEELCKNREIIKILVTELDADGKEVGLNPFERIKQICLIPDQFTIDNEMLTPTFKLKRTEVVKSYSTHIDTLLANMKLSGATK